MRIEDSIYFLLIYLCVIFLTLKKHFFYYSMIRPIYNFYCRTYQAIFRLVMPFLPWRKPILLEGEGSLDEIPTLLNELNSRNVLIITDKGLMNLGLVNNLINNLLDNSFKVVVYDETIPNPTIENIEAALELYKQNNCSAIIAFGGGSPMDCAKAVGARVARPHKSIPQMKGQLKVLKKIPLLIAIPTTSGTGSEVTLAAVVSNSITYEKYAINDTVLIPKYAVLDPSLTVKLPAHITSTTGMDALTHAVESFIGKSNTKETIEASLEAVKLIYENLYTAYITPSDLKARSNMQRASYLAGVAFTRAYVGYVHCIAHTLGGFYGVPHGLANAVILPYVLEEYGQAAHERLALLSDHLGLTDKNVSTADKANTFIRLVKDLNEKMDIPTKLDGIKSEDIPKMIKRAIAEGNPLYPVPVIWEAKDFEKIYNMIQA